MSLEFVHVSPIGTPNWNTSRTEILADPSQTAFRIETTNHCNFECTFCPNPRQKRSLGYMDETLFGKIVPQATAAGFRTLDLRNFGEPLLDKHLVERVAFAREQGFTYILIITNGFGLTAKRLDALAEAGMAQIVLSLSPKREFTETRPGTNVEKLWRDLASLKDSPYKHIVGVDYIRTGSSTLDEEAEMKRFLESIGIPLRMEVALHNWAQGPIAGSSRYLCHRLWTSFTVLWDGRVSLCCLDYEGDVVLGDLNRQSVAEVLNGPVYREIRRRHLGGEFLRKCAGCDMVQTKDLK
jgi:MoaA/NifB/PqqE/SkfB family radical SAM enzyme